MDLDTSRNRFVVLKRYNETVNKLCCVITVFLYIHLSTWTRLNVCIIWYSKTIKLCIKTEQDFIQHRYYYLKISHIK